MRRCIATFLVLVAVLPILVLALMRRLQSEERAAKRMAARERYERELAEQRAREAANAFPEQDDEAYSSGSG